MTKTPNLVAIAKHGGICITFTHTNRLSTIKYHRRFSDMEDENPKRFSKGRVRYAATGVGTVRARVWRGRPTINNIITFHKRTDRLFVKKFRNP